MLVLPPHVRHRYVADAHDTWTIWWVHVIGCQLPQGIGLLCPAAAATVVGVRQPLRAVSLLDEIRSHLRRNHTVPGILTGQAPPGSATALSNHRRTAEASSRASGAAAGPRA